jgi:hypothetical protein
MVKIKLTVLSFNGLKSTCFLQKKQDFTRFVFKKTKLINIKVKTSNTSSSSSEGGGENEGENEGRSVNILDLMYPITDFIYPLRDYNAPPVDSNSPDLNLSNVVQGFFSELDENAPVLRPDGSFATLNSSDETEVMADYISQLAELGYLSNPNNLDPRQLNVLNRTISYLIENRVINTLVPLSTQQNALNLLRRALLDVVTSPQTETVGISPLLETQTQGNDPMNTTLSFVIPATRNSSSATRTSSSASSQRDGIIAHAQTNQGFIDADFDHYDNREDEIQPYVEEDQPLVNNMQFGIIPGVGLRLGRSASSPNLANQSLPPSPRHLSPQGSHKAPSVASSPRLNPPSPRGSVSGTRPSSKAPSMRNAASAAATAAAVGAVQAAVDNLERNTLGNAFKAVSNTISSVVGTVLGKRDKKSGRDHAEEGLVPELERTRDNVNGFAKVVAGIVGFVATNQVIAILAQSFKWVKLNLLFKKGGLIFTALSAVNEYFTPQGQKIFSDVFKAQVLNGKFQLEMGQGLYPRTLYGLSSFC